MKINFIPESYIESTHKKDIKKYMILIIILLTINVIFFNKALLNRKDIDDINKQIYNLNLKKEKNNNYNNKTDRNYTLFINLYENINEGIVVDSFNIKDGKASLEGKCSDLRNYYSLLNLLEENKKINIKSLDAPEKEEEFYKFKFIME
ncbi:hypothetical protein K8O96_01475 [Clostridium sporogenes]|uniref:hypothetical protein n=1 Tax=Clostridium caseinilyticum TaxID=3350403 RepID=UPI0013D8826D|nr:hypothetical protein [Clostridium sporogenes]NFI74918.1 hypothetical protein [Clostridium sporogenes]NFM25616.1 hypothetical protein [Clostridium sporogenes]NFP63545.1 hypothetical protein [Clostridium sporogenes]NFU96601.1 hypothetical protein [Clostridium sporogenes]UAL60079.1 hypothetical protein K8O96_01475 [Clostridium sporogenes]